VNLFREVLGAGRPLVALHGGFGHDHNAFRPWLEALPVELILPDLRGCGQSPREGLEQASLATLAQDLDELRGQLGRERWIVLGHSFGAYLALEYAHGFPDRVDALILVGGAPALDYPDVIGANLAARGTPGQAALLQKAMSQQLDSDEEFRQGWNTILPLYFRNLDPAIARDMDARATYSAPALFHRFRMLSQFSALPWLGDVQAPALVLAGRHDWIAPPAQGAERLARGLPDASLVIFEESGHYPFVEENARFLSVVREFIADLV
jgi:proline iminopeptidase